MGRGNYLPSSEMGDHEMVYVEIPYEDVDEQWYDELIGDIRSSLPGSFYDIREHRVHDSTAISRNKLLDVCVADNEWSTAVFIVPREGLDEYPSEMNLAYRHINNVAKKAFDKLAKLYPLRVRCNAWCSGTY